MASKARPAEVAAKAGTVDDEDEKVAGIQPRQCTDIVCVPLFLSTFALLVYILHYATMKGDMARIYHGLDFHNQLCGATEAVKDKPYLYWCTKPGSAMTIDMLEEAGGDTGAVGSIMAYTHLLDLAHPICVNECPTNMEKYNSCFQKEIEVDGEKDETGTFERTTTFVYNLVENYPTTTLAGRYCFPQSEVLLEQLKSTFSGGAEGVMFHLSEVFNHPGVLAGAAFLSFILGYAYLFLVKTLARPLIIGSVVLSTIFMLGAGAWVLAGALLEGSGEAFAGHLGMNQTEVAELFAQDTEWKLDDWFAPSTGSKDADLVIGGALVIVGLLIPIGFCCIKHSIDLVLGSIAATLECLQDMPVLLLQPIFSIIFKLVYIAIAFIGFARVLSIGDVENHSLGGMAPAAGLARSFTFEDGDEKYVYGYIFIAIWFQEFASALEQYVFIYGTQMWFFAPYTTVLGFKKKSVNQLKILKGYFFGLTFHLGSIAFGSLILAMTRMLYILLSTMYKQAKASSDGETNKAVDAAAGCCLCCLKCWETVIRYLNKMVYIIVSANSENFCTASQTMISIMVSEFAAISLLEGATKVFQFLGMVTITGAGASLTWLTLRNVDAFSDPKSEHFVLQPEYLTIGAGVLSFTVAAVFMTVFDVVSDTVLFCWALDKKTRRENGLPPNDDLPVSLQRLLGKTSESGKQETKPLVSDSSPR